jgi:hypothetical protein
VISPTVWPDTGRTKPSPVTKAKIPISVVRMDDPPLRGFVRI